MPLLFLAALAGSLAIHAAALFLPEVDLSTLPPPPPVTAELQPPTPPAAKASKPVAPSAPNKHQPAPRHQPQAVPAVSAAPAAEVPVANQPPAAAQHAEPETAAQPKELESQAAASGPEPHLPGTGYIRFTVYKGSEGLVVGRAEHRWEFAEGHYRLTAITETTGLAALIKPIRVELESRGSLTADGLQPEYFATRRNGAPTNENADFDWSTHEVLLGRDGRRYPLESGAQDLLSFHYQFGALAGGMGEGLSVEVATGKKFERYRFDVLEQSEVDTPAGRFRTVHVRARSDSTTELWLALDRQRVPVKIRYTDKKGDSFEQVATELGMQ